jgi:hypothetical protein
MLLVTTDKPHLELGCLTQLVVIVWWLDLQLPVQSVLPTNTKVVSSNPAHGELYSIQHYVIKFISDLRQVCGLLCH